ncbi:hypothetical protein GEMRC1_009393 [Eukaryota sp. GEM-RC1]
MILLVISLSLLVVLIAILLVHSPSCNNAPKPDFDHQVQEGIDQLQDNAVPFSTQINVNSPGTKDLDNLVLWALDCIEFEDILWSCDSPEFFDKCRLQPKTMFLFLILLSLT